MKTINWTKFRNRSLMVIFISLAMGAGYGIMKHRIDVLKTDLQQANTAHTQLATEFASVQTIVTRLGDSLQVADQIILSQRQAIEMGLLRERELKDKHLKVVQNVIELQEQVSILKKQGKYTNTVYIRIFDSLTYLKIPSTMDFSDQWYCLSVTADRTPMLNELTVFSEPTITLGTTKDGLFKRPRQVVIYENQNPYVKLKDVSSLTIKEQEKWWQTTWFKVGVGVTGGLVFGGLMVW